MPFSVSDSIKAVDDAGVPGQVILKANGVKFASVSPDGKLNLYPVADLGLANLKTDASGRVITVLA